MTRWRWPSLGVLEQKPGDLRLEDRQRLELQPEKSGEISEELPRRSPPVTVAAWYRLLSPRAASCSPRPCAQCQAGESVYSR